MCDLGEKWGREEREKARARAASGLWLAGDDAIMPCERAGTWRGGGVVGAGGGTVGGAGAQNEASVRCRYGVALYCSVCTLRVHAVRSFEPPRRRCAVANGM